MLCKIENSDTLVPFNFCVVTRHYKLKTEKSGWKRNYRKVKLIGWWVMNFSLVKFSAKAKTNILQKFAPVTTSHLTT